MPTGTTPSVIARPVPSPLPAGGAPTAAHLFVIRYSATLLPLLVAVVALELGWHRLAGDSWAAALALVTGWVPAVAAWLHRRGWRAGTVLAVVGLPLGVPAGSAAVDGLSPAGLALWGPVGTVLAVALAMVTRPPALAGPSARP
ncbi:hypothetical protein ACI782_09015 [Geodermatophilus sp. SYSU D00703]